MSGPVRKRNPKSLCLKSRQALKGLTEGSLSWSSRTLSTTFSKSLSDSNWSRVN